MATWNLTLDNAANASTVYVIEDDETNSITTPYDLFYPLCFEQHCDSNLAKRFYASLAIGGDDFPPVCKAVVARGTGLLIVGENTRFLKVWTYGNGVWTTQANITDGIVDRATITIPSYEPKPDPAPRR
jgi:hypothetical protein